MTTYKEDREIGDLISEIVMGELENALDVAKISIEKFLTDRAYDDFPALVGDIISPNDVFSFEVLEEWALANGFVKEAK